MSIALIAGFPLSSMLIFDLTSLQKFCKVGRMEIHEAIFNLRKYFGSHSAVAKALGYSVGHYSHLRHVFMSPKAEQYILLFARNTLPKDAESSSYNQNTFTNNLDNMEIQGKNERRS